MVFQLNVDYKTVYGEELVLNITIDGKEVQHKMRTSDGQRWVYDLDVTPKSKLAPIIIVWYVMDFAARVSGRW